MTNILFKKNSNAFCFFGERYGDMQKDIGENNISLKIANNIRYFNLHQTYCWHTFPSKEISLYLVKSRACLNCYTVKNGHV